MNALIRFAVATHPHMTGQPFTNRASLELAASIWRNTAVGRGIGFFGTTKRLRPLDDIKQASEAIAAGFPGTFHLATDGHWRKESFGVRWTVALRKTAVVVTVELDATIDLHAAANCLPNNHRRILQTVPGATSMGFLSAVELSGTDTANDVDIGRFATTAVADLFDPLQVVHDTEKRIVATLKQSLPDLAVAKVVDGRHFLNWLRPDVTPDEACQNRLDWLVEAAAP